MEEPAIELRDVSKSFGGQRVLDSLSLSVPHGRTLALVGPSGCGKTTTLKLINRLVEPSVGEIWVEGERVDRVDAVELRRRIGYVVQEAGLFPHMTARDNVELVPDLIGWPAPRRAARAMELFALVGLPYERFSGRYPAQLSGGQRQRVGLARALAVDPALVLMDEPFGALDPIIRSHLQKEFLAITRRLNKTVVIVTHDMEEAFELADQVAVLGQGRLHQIGTPAALLDQPASDLVRELIEVSGLRSATVAARGAG